jgi:hypothetical protein
MNIETTGLFHAREENLNRRRQQKKFRKEFAAYVYLLEPPSCHVVFLGCAGICVSCYLNPVIDRMAISSDL